MADLRDVAGEFVYQASLVDVAPDGTRYKDWRPPEPLSFQRAKDAAFAESVMIAEGFEPEPGNLGAYGYPSNRQNVLGFMRQNKLYQWGLYLADLEAEERELDRLAESFGDDAERFAWWLDEGPGDEDAPEPGFFDDPSLVSFENPPRCGGFGFCGLVAGLGLALVVLGLSGRLRGA